MDWLLWIVRAVIIVVGIIIIAKVGKKKWPYYLGFIVIGITAFSLGVILLIVSSITDLSLFYGLYLSAAGAVGTILGLVVRNIQKKKNR